MRRRRLFWQLFPSYIIIILLSLIAVTWFASYSFKNFFINQSKADLISRARLIEERFIDLIDSSRTAEIDSLCKYLGRLSLTRITVVAPSGKVLGDTEENPEVMDNHNDRPEILQAKREGSGSAIRYSHTLSEEMLYVAVPLPVKDGQTGALRLSIALTSIHAGLESLNTKIIIGGLIIAFLITMLSLYLTQKISRPLVEIRQGAESFASGDFSRRIPVYNSQEIGGLAESMNKMAEDLDYRIRTIIRQRNEQEAVLASMVEGVLAIDKDERIIGYNQAGGKLLGISTSEAEGKTLHEVIRNIDLQRFVARVLSTQETSEEEIVLRDSGERYIQLHGTIIKDSRGGSIGALVVLNDVTRLHRLEAVRREFVANVSHELKTPVTSIKGFVETLIDGAVDDPESARRFLDVISRQADRLSAIISDLLTLSRMEQDSGKTQISLRLEAIRPVLKTAIQVCELKAKASDIRIKLSCPEDLKTKINAPLLEQAVINLIDNAIKFSETGSIVGVGASRENGEVVIRVTDRGSGIPKEHLSRLFERFYIADKARSRKLGGTGLGLAIVKHIAQVHNGYPKVESTPGKGSTFSIHIPAADQDSA